MSDWYVIAEGWSHVPEKTFEQAIWGPFNCSADAVTFAMDTEEENGWTEVKPSFMTAARAEGLAQPNKVIQPYQ